MVLAGGAATGGPEKSGLWLFLAPPLGNTNINEIVIDPNNDALWYVTSSTNGLYITRDSGATWEQHLSGNVGAVAIAPQLTLYVFASSGSDLYLSVDSGNTWNLLESFPDMISGSPDSPTFIDSILVSAVDSAVVVGLSSQQHSARVYKSVVAGGVVSWDIVWESPHGYHIWDLAEDPVNGYWFLSTEDSSHLENPVVMRSKNRGETWEEMLPLTGYLTDGHGLNLAVHPVTRTVYFLTESSILYTSNDSGDSWSDPRYVGFGASLLLDRNCSNRVFGGEFVRGTKVGGVYISQDGSQTFLFDGPANNTIGSLALNSDSTRLLAVTPGAGIWYRDLDGSLPCTNDVVLFSDGFDIGDLTRWSSSIGGP